MSSPASLHDLRAEIRKHTIADENGLLRGLIDQASLGEEARAQISAAAADLVRAIRAGARPGLMESFLDEYGLSTREGIALMCLAEALLRVPDAETIDALIEDKIVPSDWGRHLGKSSSSLVNASTWALMLTGRVLDEDEEEGLGGALHGAIRRLGEPVIRLAVGRAMRELGSQFVLGETINSAMARAEEMEEQGYTYSYDMLGEAARTADDAERYFQAYSSAIAAISRAGSGRDVRANPGISVKLSALHPRYEQAQARRVKDELLPRILALAVQARAASIGLNIDAEEADRLDLSLDMIEQLMGDPALSGWDGFGVVVQAYGRRAAAVLDWLYALAGKTRQRIMVRLVKGAYWDSEIKRAQMLGLEDFPVFTRKPSTDVSYIACARKLFAMTDRIYPQFATHNAHSVAAILHMAESLYSFEFQRLHGMGEALHDHLHRDHGARCRIYAPVGAHEDLLAYLVRRLLENGANSSFVHQIVDEEVAPEEVAADPFAAVEACLGAASNPHIAAPPNLFQPERANSKGWDLTDPETLAEIDKERGRFRDHRWQAGPMLAVGRAGGEALPVLNPADPADQVGDVREAGGQDVETAIAGGAIWEATANERAACLVRAAGLYEQHACELFALAAREAGKGLPDCVSEVREACDFLRYYAAQAEKLATGPRGLFACISPWNFPLAIFTGQIAAALAAGNGVLAKPAEATSLIAARAVELLHAAGVPVQCLQLLPGRGSVVGSALTSDSRVAGVCFTGSTATARAINRAMAEHLDPAAPLIAETGGINAMIVDSTALPEQAVRDILASAFQSAGQRCSALRCLYIQEDVKDRILEMLLGAMDELKLGNPWRLETDVGPVISKTARKDISAHVDKARADGRLIRQLDGPATGHFVGPALIGVSSIADIEREVFGPVLHVATYAAADIDKVVSEINATGYGLTFGLHTRIDDRVQHIVDKVRAGNIYVNRNQIGAVVGSQPFGGEGLSGTGPKAGGPHYVPRFAASETPHAPAPQASFASVAAVEAAIKALGNDGTAGALSTADLPGPTGESNRLSLFPRGLVICAGPDADSAAAQADEARAAGCAALTVAPGVKEGVDGLLPTEAVGRLDGFSAVMFWGEPDDARLLRQALAARDGQLIPLICETGEKARLMIERHVCIDTTAAGGNTSLLAAAG